MRAVRIVLCTGLTALAAAEEKPAAPLTQAEMQPILRALQSQYGDPKTVDHTALNRAAIDGLLQQHPDTLQLVTVPDEPPAPPPLLAEALTPRIACLRPGGFRPEDLTALRESLTKLAAGDTATVILDLRNPASDADPAAAAVMAGLFLPRDTSLFTLNTAAVKTTDDPVWKRDIVVLIDRDTSNTGEILAALLQVPKRAFLIGTTTRGRTAVINRVPVRKVEGGNLVLQFTAQRVVFAAGSDPFGKGLVPDMPAAQDATAKAAVMARQAQDGLSATVFLKARPTTNEAALVARTNPELPDRIRRTAGEPSPYDTQLADRPLQVAVDILTAGAVLKTTEKK